MNEKIKSQILAIRDTGLTNMFDLVTIQRIAYEREYFELACYIEEHSNDYCHFILTGES